MGTALWQLSRTATHSPFTWMASISSGVTGLHKSHVNTAAIVPLSWLLKGAVVLGKVALGMRENYFIEVV